MIVLVPMRTHLSGLNNLWLTWQLLVILLKWRMSLQMAWEGYVPVKTLWNILMGKIYFVWKTSRHPLKIVLWSRGNTVIIPIHTSGQVSIIKYSYSSDLKLLLWFYSEGGKPCKHGETQVLLKHPVESEMLLAESINFIFKLECLFLVCEVPTPSVLILEVT